MPRRPSQNPRKYRSPSEHGIEFESHNIQCSDGVFIHAWLLLRDQNRANDLPTLVFFHGNAGNIGLRLPNAIQMLQYLNANVLMVEYRGYGESDGSPSEAGLKLDAEAALRFILKHPKIDAANVFLFGRSLGGAVAFHLAEYAQQQHLPLAGVIIENTFTNIAEMVDSLMPLIAPLKALVLRIRWDSLSIVPKLNVPVLYLAGARDELVPHDHMVRMYKATKASKLVKMHVIKDGTHNETWLRGGNEYWVAMRDFLSQAARQTSLSSAADTSQDFSSSIRPTSSSSSTMLPPNGAAVASTTTSTNSAIPIMPSNILNIAQESLRTASAAELPDKKEL
jgi:pimeloyl-ACP methyl ester carboxylesterase